jgi:hypothetical protein
MNSRRRTGKPGPIITSDHPYFIGTRLSAAIIVDDFETHTLIFPKRVCIHQIIRVNEDVGTAAIRNDKSESADFVVLQNSARRHF